MSREVVTPKLIFEIFLTFLKISPVTFGGGYAMIPLIEREVVERKQWISTEELADVFAVSESVPGAIAINSATFIGYRLGGVLGAIAAMVGILIPAFVIIVSLSIFYLQVQDHPKVIAAFVSIRATVVALITYAAIKIGKSAIVDKSSIVLIISTVVLMWFVHVHPVFVIVSGAAIGIILSIIRRRMNWKTPTTHEKPKYNDYYIGDGI